MNCLKNNQDYLRCFSSSELCLSAATRSRYWLALISGISNSNTDNTIKEGKTNKGAVCHALREHTLHQKLCGIQSVLYGKWTIHDASNIPGARSLKYQEKTPAVNHGLILFYGQSTSRTTSLSENEMNIRLPLCYVRHLDGILKISLGKQLLFLKQLML